MQAALRTLGAPTKQKTVILYTLIVNDKFYLLLITPDEVKSFESLIKASELNEKILQFYAVLQSPNYDPGPLGKELYDIIFTPVEAELAGIGARTLLWSLDGRLRYVPMAALWDGEKYLVERYQNVAFTRNNIEWVTYSGSRDWTGTGFGNSQPQIVNLFGSGLLNFSALPGVNAELKEIFKTRPTDRAGILAGEVFANRQFTKAAFYEAMKARRPVVHIANHFSLPPRGRCRIIYVAR